MTQRIPLGKIRSIIISAIFCFFVCLLGFMPSETHADARGISVKARTRTGETRDIKLYSGYHALVVGCGDYRAGWPRLPNPVKDAREVASTLEKIGCDVDLLEDPDWKTLRRALNQLITGPGRDPDKAVLFWFSGHGHTLSEVGGRSLGYIVPVDAPNPDRDEIGFMEKAISMRQIETYARRIRARHALMLFDSCFSGAIFQAVRSKPSLYIEEKVKKPVRQFITAGNQSEQVPDHSVFKTVFVQSIEDGYADRNKDGYVTGMELGDYLQEQVVNYSRGAQHPQFGKINDPTLDKGDFVFLLASSGTIIETPSVPSQTKGRLSVNANVTDAEVIVDGRFVGRTPVGTMEVSAGSHRVQVKKEGLDTYHTTVEVTAGRTASLEAYMTKSGPKTGRLYVNTEPSDARIRILNIGPKFYQGIELSPGSYHVEVSAPNHGKQTRWVKLFAGEDKRIAFRLSASTFPPPGISAKDGKLDGPSTLDSHQITSQDAEDGRKIAENKILYDKRTGLEWVSGPDNDINWEKAKSWASELDLDGGGWRMPSRKELEKVFMLGSNENNVIPLFQTTGLFVWSVEFLDAGYGEPPYGWCYEIKSGGVSRIPVKKTNGMRAFAVRSKPGLDLLVNVGNDIFYDKRTGLEWVSGPDNDINWGKAKSWASELDLDGGGWRMPSRKELENVFMLGSNENNGIPLFQTTGRFVWSVEFLDAGYGEPPSGWCYEIKSGGVIRIPVKKTKGMRAFAVRSKPDIDLLVNVGNDIFYDKRTGLEWVSGPDNDINWEDAKSWASELDLDGGGWRMPTRKELENVFMLGSNENNVISLFQTTGLFVWSVEFLDAGYGEPPYGWCYEIKSRGVSRIPVKKTNGMRAFAVR